MGNLPHHVFWDFDGTLFDTYPQITEALLKALNDFHVDEQFTRNEVLRELKGSCTIAIAYCAAKAQVDENLLSQSFQRYHKATYEFHAYEGLAECLASLCDKGCKHYLYTHRNQTAIQCLQEIGLWKYFSDGVISNMAFPLKPNPAALQWLCREHNLRTEDCIMVGDRDIDLIAGANAGMHGILFDPDNFFTDYQAEWRVSSMQDIITLYS